MPLLMLRIPEVEAVVEEEVAEMEMVLADAPVTQKPKEKRTCQRKRKCPVDASNTSEVEAVVEEEVAEMEMAPADAPANETEAVEENVSETEMPLPMPRIPPKSKR